MKSKKSKSGHDTLGPTQRQLRAGEMIRHALVEILREEEFHDAALSGVSITLTEVRMSPDLKHAICFVEPLGAGLNAGMSERMAEILKALNSHARYVRGVLGRRIASKFTPDVKFIHDDSFDEASRISKLFHDPVVARDLRADSYTGGSHDFEAAAYDDDDQDA